MLLLLLGCESNRTTLIVPGQVRRALAQLTDLSATAELVADDGTRQVPVPLERAEDGVSFSGFLPAEPGEYRLEVVFAGIAVGRPDRIFLGRWVSDTFTVQAGATATPSFTRAIDTIGGPDDGGDPDGDGFGNLDEIIWGTDLSNPDSDGDGVRDGSDCSPGDMADAFTILAGGRIEDCDNDGVRRPDVPGGGGGNDCSDRDAAIHPGLTDDCSNGVDEDCNPSTCPMNDVMAPMISSIVPPTGSTVGCHTRVRANVTDDGSIASATVYLEEPVPGMPLTLWMTRGAGNEFVAPPFNTYVAFGDGLLTGQHSIEVRAQDSGGNMTAETLTYDFEYAVPRITAMNPRRVGSVSAPFTVDITATSPRGVASLLFMAVKRNGAGLYNTDMAIEIGRTASESGSFTVDPAALGDGEHLLFPVVIDPIGNELRPPSSYAHPIGAVDGIEIDGDFRCISMPAQPKIPALVIVVGANGYQPATFQDLLSEALSQASATDPGAQLVQVVGLGIRADGTVGLDDAASFTKRWTFGFYNSSANRWMSVAWLTPAFAITNPMVDPDDGSISSTDPLPNPSALVDSSAAAAAYAQAGCPPLMGSESDYIIYQFLDGQSVVTLSAEGGGFWRGTATEPITQIIPCN